MAITVDGLSTGINTTQIIEALLTIGRRRIGLLENNKKGVAAQQTAFKTLEARLLSLQTTTTRLGRSVGGVFQTRTAASSDETRIKATASSSASSGTYTLRVNSLARAHQIASQGFDSPDALVTQGAFQIRVGSGATATITIDSTNNTLRGLAGAINAAGAGVTATIINDGSGSLTQPHRLLLVANNHGAANTISVTNNLGADSGGAIKPELNGNFIGAAVTEVGYTGTSTPTSNRGAGGYTGTANDTYTFTVVTGGTVGVTNGIQVSYVDGSGENSGTLTINSTDVDLFKTVAEGLQVKFNAGTLVNGEKFTVDAFVPTVQQPANASVTLGSGAGSLTVQSETNRVENLITGVTLDLLTADSTKDVTVTIANDVKAAREAVLDFVKSYNDVIGYLEEQSRFDSQTQKAGILLGSSSAISIQQDLQLIATDAVAGVSAQMNRFSALGVTVNALGKLDVNETKLNDALNGRVTGVTMDDVARLFALAGKSTNPGISFITGSTRTKATNLSVQVDLSQAAEQAAITATNSLATSTVINSANNALTITVNGKLSGTITLADGTYSRAALASELQAKIKADSTLAGRGVTVSLVGDRLKITSDIYGYTSETTIGTGSALGALGFVGTETDRGQDVVGKFIVNGVDEPATGTGQLLVGNSTNANTADLQVRAILTGTQIVAGSEATLTLTRGVASRLGQTLTSMLDPVIGDLKNIDNSFQKRIDAIALAIQRQNENLELRRQSLLKQFTALESVVGQLKGTGEFLTTQLLAINNLRRR